MLFNLLDSGDKYFCWVQSNDIATCIQNAPSVDHPPWILVL